MERIDLKRLSIVDWMTLYTDNGPFELIDGEIIELPPQGEQSGSLGGSLFFHIRAFASDHKLGKVFVETAFVLTDDTDWVLGSRQPDVMFFAADRWAHYVASPQRDKKGPIRIVPDMVAEVISPTDKATAVHNKVATYLADGVQLIWLIYPDSETVVVHRAGQNLSETVRSGDSLSGEAIIPGFTLSLDTLFAE